jgi:hypothetical protein
VALQEISSVRFDSLAGYARQPTAKLWGEEVRWAQAANESILVAVIRDFEDNDFSAMLFARDLKERYRWISMTEWAEGVDDALLLAIDAVQDALADLDAERVQGDEKGKPVEFFVPHKSAKQLNPEFSMLAEQEAYSPAKAIIESMMRWHEDADGNFIQQFQTTGFDARLWELYLFAMLQEAGYSVAKAGGIPDFCVEGLSGKISIEATIVSPSRNAAGDLVEPPPRTTAEEQLAFLNDYMPTRFSGRLTDKLSKKYWERESVKGAPLVLAIQDFHAPMSMEYTAPSLSTYLYGFQYDGHNDTNGNPLITPKKIEKHSWGAKVVQSAFFELPGAEYISAVISNPSSTISKFNRMGVKAGFGSRRVQLTRIGNAVDHTAGSARSTEFKQVVNSTDYKETWIEGMDVYHNPNAKFPLDIGMLPGAAHHWPLPDGRIESRVPAWQLISAETTVVIQD